MEQKLNIGVFMDHKIVYNFLKDLGNEGISYLGKIMSCFDNRRMGVWNDETFEAVKKGLKLWWYNRYEFYVYVKILGGAVWAA